MKKRVKIVISLIIAIVIFLFLLLVINLSKPNYLGVKSKINVTNSLNMAIKDSTLSKTSAIVVLKNNSKDNYVYGQTFSLEVKFENKWYELKQISKSGNTTEGYILKPGESIELTLNWKDRYELLNDINYRIVKEVSLEGSKVYEYIVTEFQL